MKGAVITYSKKGCIYSTNEVLTADKWIDGKRIYTKTISGTYQRNTVVANIPDIDSIIEIKGAVKGSDGSQWPASIGAVTNGKSGTFRINDDGGIECLGNSDFANQDFHLTLRYTKTSETGEIKKAIFGYSISLHRDISLNIYIEESYVSQINKVEAIASSGTSTFSNADIQSTEYGYRVSVPIAVKEMTDTIQIKIYGTDESILADESISVNEYAQKIINGEYSEDIKNIIRCMLTYGKYAQIYFEYNTDNLPTIDTEVMMDESEVIDSTCDPIEIKGDKSPPFVGALLVLKYKPGLKLYYLEDDKELKYEEYGKIIEDEAHRYRIVAYTELENIRTVTSVSDSNGYELKYSIYSFFQQVMKKENTEDSNYDDLKKLCRAMATYYSIFD